MARGVISLGGRAVLASASTAKDEMMNRYLSGLLLTPCIVTMTPLLSGQELARAPDIEQMKAVPASPDGGMPFGAYQDTAGCVHADGGQYRAEFDAAGVMLATPPITADGEEPSFELRYLGSRRAGSAAVVEAAVLPELAEHCVRYQRDELVETYEVKSNGYEQSFHIAQRPRGMGDLVLSMAVTGNVSAPAVEPRHQALEFVYEGARVIRYGEAIAFDRGGLRVAVLTSYDGHGRLELTVPARFVDRATYPIVVDPAVGPVFNPGGPTWEDRNPEVAYHPKFDTYMVVWQRRFSTTSFGIRAQRFASDGTALGGVIFLTPSGVNVNPAVAAAIAFGANAFKVVWEKSGRIYARLVNAYTGAFITAAFAVSNPAPGEADHRPSVSGPYGMIVAWDRTLVGATQPQRLMLRRYHYYSTGAVAAVTNETVLTSVSSGYIRSIRLPRSSTKFVAGGNDFDAQRAVWERFYPGAPGDMDVRTASFVWSVVSPVLTIVQQPLSVFAGGLLDDEVTPDIACRTSDWSSSNDRQYCIAWEDEGDVYAQMFDLNGTLGAPFPVRNTANYEGMPAVGAGFCEFTIAYGEIIPPAQFSVNVYAARVLLNGTVTTNHRPVDVLNGPFQSNIAVSSRPSYRSGVPGFREANTALIVWNGETGPTGAASDDIRARFFEPIVANLTPFGSPCPGPLGEMPMIGTAGGNPTAGNVDFEITVSGGLSNSFGLLVFSNVLTTTTVPGAPGCLLFAGLPWINFRSAPLDATGFGTANIPIPCSIPSGATLAFQWLVYSPTSNSYGFILSNDLDINWFQ